MVKFLTAENSYSKIVDTIIEASNKVVLISPYIKLPADFLERLKYRDKQGFQTVVVCREKNLNDEARSNLKQLKYLDLRFDDVLHAKCFHNEKSMVITSLNLHEHSQQNNREMGILLSSDEDSDTFKEALREANFIVDSAKKDSPIRNIIREAVKEAKAVVALPTVGDVRKAKTSSRASTKGYCIRCEKSIPYDLKSPYCSRCYRVWSKFKDSNYEEEYCHKCGTPNEATTMKRPLCDSCYGKSRS
ncbi:hypothetical protein ES707_15895 [subsurface metagenome]